VVTEHYKQSLSREAGSHFLEGSSPSVSCYRWDGLLRGCLSENLSLSGWPSCSYAGGLWVPSSACSLGGCREDSQEGGETAAIQSSRDGLSAS